MRTSSAAITAAVEREIAAAVSEGHVGYLDLRITVEHDAAAPEQEIVVLEAVRRPHDAPPAADDVWRIPVALTAEAVEAHEAAGVHDAPLALDALAAAIDGLVVAAGTHDIDEVEVVLDRARDADEPEGAAPHSPSGPTVTFTRERGADGARGATWVFEGRVAIDREFIADTSAYSHLRAWLCEALGPRCIAIDVHRFDGRVAHVRARVHADGPGRGRTANEPTN